MARLSILIVRTRTCSSTCSLTTVSLSMVAFEWCLPMLLVLVDSALIACNICCGPARNGWFMAGLSPANIWNVQHHLPVLCLLSFQLVDLTLACSETESGNWHMCSGRNMSQTMSHLLLFVLYPHSLLPMDLQRCILVPSQSKQPTTNWTQHHTRTINEAPGNNTARVGKAHNHQSTFYSYKPAHTRAI